MTLYKYGVLTILIIFTELTPSLLAAAESDIATIFDGRPYILNLTAGTFFQDAHRSLTASGYEKLSNKNSKTIYYKSDRKIKVEISSNSEKRVLKIVYINNNKFTESDISRRGKAFENLSKENLVCRAALPYSVDCFYKVNNEQGRYSFTGIFQRGGIQYVLEGKPKFTLITGFRSLITNPENQTNSEQEKETE